MLFHKLGWYETEVRLWLGWFWEQTRHRGVNYPGLSVFGFSKFLHIALCQFECGTYPRMRTCSPHRRLSLRHHIKSSPCLVASTSRRGLSSLSALRAQLYRSCIYVCLLDMVFGSVSPLLISHSALLWGTPSVRDYLL